MRIRAKPEKAARALFIEAVIRERHFKGITFDEIGRMYGLTGQAVGHILKKALRKMARNPRLKELVIFRDQDRHLTFDRARELAGWSGIK